MRRAFARPFPHSARARADRARPDPRRHQHLRRDLGRAQGARPHRDPREARLLQHDAAPRRADRRVARLGRPHPARAARQGRRRNGGDGAEAARRARPHPAHRRAQRAQCARPAGAALQPGPGVRSRGRRAPLLRRAPRRQARPAAPERTLSRRPRRAMARHAVAAAERPRRCLRRRGGGGDRPRSVRPALQGDRPGRRRFHHPALEQGHADHARARPGECARPQVSGRPDHERHRPRRPLRRLGAQPDHRGASAARHLRGTGLSAARGKRRERRRGARAVARRGLAGVRPHAAHLGGDARPDRARRLGPGAARARAQPQLEALPGDDRAQRRRADPVAADQPAASSTPARRWSACSASRSRTCAGAR